MEWTTIYTHSDELYNGLKYLEDGSYKDILNVKYAHELAALETLIRFTLDGETHLGFKNLKEGFKELRTIGRPLGCEEGCRVGCIDGRRVGCLEGCDEGRDIGNKEGCDDGCVEGSVKGIADG